MRADPAVRRSAGPVCHLAYRKGGDKLAAKGWDYDEMARGLSAAYRRAAQENNALLADVGARFYALAGTLDLYAADGVHPASRAPAWRRRCFPLQSKTGGGKAVIREICRDEAFLARKGAARHARRPGCADDLLETLRHHKEGCVGMAANMIGVDKRHHRL